MLIVIFGESCTGKSTLAQILSEKLDAQIYTGKDYLRLAKNEAIAKKLFQKKLEEAVTDGHMIYVTAQPQELIPVPPEAIRILVTAELETIKERFALRMHGTLPKSVADMLERNHGCFDREAYDYRVMSGKTDVYALAAQIAAT